MTRCGTCSARPLRVFSASSRFAAVCRFPFSSIKSQTLLGPLRISHSFSTRCRLAHISPILSERFVPTAPARGPVSNLFLVGASQVQDVEMCAHLSTVVFKGWVPGRLGASDGRQNLYRRSPYTMWGSREAGSLHREAK